MTQKREPVGCMRALLKPGQKMPEPPSNEELRKGIQEGRIFAVINGKRVVPQQP